MKEFFRVTKSKMIITGAIMLLLFLLWIFRLLVNDGVFINERVEAALMFMSTPLFWIMDKIDSMLYVYMGDIGECRFPHCEIVQPGLFLVYFLILGILFSYLVSCCIVKLARIDAK